MTLRERAEAILRLAPRDESQYPMLAIHEHARAIIAALDAAPLDIFTSRFDPVPGEDAVRLVPERRYVSISDPGLRRRPDGEGLTRGAA